MMDFMTECSGASGASKGAIPKRPRMPKPEYANSSEDLSKDLDNSTLSERSRFNRKALRRRPPTPPTSATGSHVDMVAASIDLRQRILEILSTNNEDCSKELTKLKKELEDEETEAVTTSEAGPTEAQIINQVVSSTTRSNSRRRTNRNRRQRHQNDGSTETNETDGEQKRRRRAARRAERMRRLNSSPPSSISNIIGGAPGTHLATDHEDTSEGAVHCFQDELGNWHSYTFAHDSAGTASMVAPGTSASTSARASVTTAASTERNGSSTVATVTGLSRSSSSISINSGLTVILDNPTIVFQPKNERRGSGDKDSVIGDTSVVSTNPTQPPNPDSSWPSPTLLR